MRWGASEQEVRQPVAIVVKDRDAGAHDLREQKVFGRRRRMSKVDTDGVCDVDKGAGLGAGSGQEEERQTV